MIICLCVVPLFTVGLKRITVGAVFSLYLALTHYHCHRYIYQKQEITFSCSTSFDFVNGFSEIVKKDSIPTAINLHFRRP